MIRRQGEQSGLLPETQAPHVGDSLRQQREQLGWDLGEVAEWLRIRRSYLQALEDGRSDGLPSGAYTIGFLRSYAAALGLDPQEATERFRRESRGLLAQPHLSFPSPVPQRGVPAGAAILLGMVLLIGAYAGWYVFSAHDAGTVQAVPAVPDAMLAPPAASPGAPAAAPARPVSHPAAAPVQAAALPAAAPPAARAVPDASPATASAAPPKAEPAAPPASPLVTATSPAAAPPAAVPAATASSGAIASGATASGAIAPGAGPAGLAPAGVARVTLKAVAATWVQVRKADGTVIYDHVLAPGESWTVPDATPPLVLVTGNAGGLTLGVGDAVGPPLGRSGAVRRNLSLDADAVRSLNARLGGQGATPASPPGHRPAP